MNNKLNKLCYQDFIRCNNNVKMIEASAILNNLTVEEFLNNVYLYIKENIEEPEFVKILDKLGNCNTNEEIINYLDSIQIDFKYLNNNVLPYFLNYRPHLIYLDNSHVNDLKSKLKVYEVYLYRKLNPLRSTSKDLDEDFINNINEFINSKYSLSRFCYNKGLSITQITRSISKIKNNYPDIYEKFLEYIELNDNIKEQTIEFDVKNILNYIKENNGISIIDLCGLTNFGILELTKASEKVLDKDDNLLFRQTIKHYNQIDYLKDERLTRLFKTDFVYNINDNLIKITEEDKYTIINYLYELDIPICNETIHEGFKKLLNTREENVINKRH